MSPPARRPSRLANLAAPIMGMGAGALYLARSRARGSLGLPPLASDASFVELIERVGAETNRAPSIEAAMRACVEQLCRWTGWPLGHVYLAGRGVEDPLEPTRLWHLGHPDRFAAFCEATERLPLPPGVGLPGRVLSSGRPAWITDVLNDANFPRLAEAREVGLRGAFSFPVPVNGRCFAVLECFSLQAVTPDERLLEVTAHIGRQLGRVVENRLMEEALRESETRFRSVAESATDAIVSADRHGDIISWNRGAELMFGYAEDEVLGRPLSILMPERFRPLHDAGLRRVAENGVSASRLIGSTVEVVGLRSDGREFPLELSLATWETSDGRFFSGIIRDISERKKVEDKLRALLETAPDPIVEVGPDRRIILANARTDQLFGYVREEIVGRPVEELFAPRSRELVAERFRAALAGESAESGPMGLGLELWGRRGDDVEFPVDITLSPLTTDDGIVVTSIIRDITERKRFETQLKHLADHDALTGLFNRRRFEEELNEYVSYAARYSRCGALLLLDLDRFKNVNDTRGHKAGDEVIRSIANALRDAVRKTDVVARLGGDEFAVLVRDVDRAGAEKVAEEALAAVRGRALPLEGHRVKMTTSIGVALFGDDEPRGEDLLVAADLAMYAAKETGGNRVHVTTGDGAQVSGMQARLGWADKIRRALDEERFQLYCQPILELRSGEVTQYELLLRLVGENGEVHPPAAFIDVAERYGLIKEIDLWVVGQAIDLLALHQQRGRALRLEVNVSGRSMSDSQIPDLVERGIIDGGIDPSGLVFEITETAAIANMEEAREFADRLTRMGCRFALDDFGSGFSSFYYLKYLPLDYLKIDGDFIRSLTSSVTDQLVVKSMVDIARGLGMKTIAEYVEAPETVTMLRNKGVDYSQGFLHGRPRPVTAVLGNRLELPAPRRVRT